MTTKAIEQTAIILCAGEHGRVVLFGWVDRLPVPGKPVTLYDCRMAMRWTGKRGCIGLSTHGPDSGSNISPASIEQTVTIWQEWGCCSDAAANAFDGWAT